MYFCLFPLYFANTFIYIFFKKLFLILTVHCTHVFLWGCVPVSAVACGGQERASDPVDLVYRQL